MHSPSAAVSYLALLSQHQPGFLLQQDFVLLLRVAKAFPLVMTAELSLCSVTGATHRSLFSLSHFPSSFHHNVALIAET